MVLVGGKQVEEVHTDSDRATFLKGYTSYPWGQLHWRMWQPIGPIEYPDLYCFHPSPFSGIAFEDIGPLLAQGRRVIAPDYPGFGGSDPLAEPPWIEDYAAAMALCIGDLSGRGAANILGFHTGCFVACELALANAQLIDQVCLIDVPAFPAETSEKAAASYAESFEIEDDLAGLQSLWDGVFVKRLKTQGREAAFAFFAEQLRAGIHMNDAFRAAFAYHWQDRLAILDIPTLVIGTQSALLDATREAANRIKGARYVERLDITRSVLNEAAREVSGEVCRFLTQAHRAGETPSNC